MTPKTLEALKYLERENFGENGLADGEFTTKMYAETIGSNHRIAYSRLTKNPNVEKRMSVVDGHVSTAWRLK